MRELKFRAWDSARRLMHKAVLPIMSDAFVVFAGIGEHIVCGTLQKGIIMQYTDLNDKNGKEIYEGDIIQTKAWNTGANGICVLSDKNSYMKKIVVAYFNESPFVGFRIPSVSEVIGNIHENPELLKEGI